MEGRQTRHVFKSVHTPAVAGKVEGTRSQLAGALPRTASELPRTAGALPRTVVVVDELWVGGGGHGGHRLLQKAAATGDGEPSFAASCNGAA